MTLMQASKASLRSLWRPAVPAIRPCSRCAPRRPQSTLLDRAGPHLPRILQPSMWESIVPSTIRERTRALIQESRSKKTNPATYFIWIYLLIGSQAIRIVQVKKDYNTYARKAELQLQKLREVVQKLQAGEEVDVEKVLGTGVPEEEEAWEEAMREIMDEERIWNESKKRKREAKERKRLEEDQVQREREDASPVSSTTDETIAKIVDASKPPSAPGFY